MLQELGLIVIETPLKYISHTVRQIQVKVIRNRVTGWQDLNQHRPDTTALVDRKPYGLQFASATPALILRILIPHEI